MDVKHAPDIEILPIAPEHIESYREALDSVAREKKYLAMVEAPPLPETRAFVMEMIAKRNPQFVALSRGEVVGWCDISRHFFPSRAHRGTLGMGIVAGYRGRGLGRRLIKTTLEQAQRDGFTRVELDAYADNPRAISLYEKVGFVTEGVVRNAALIDGIYKDAVLMSVLY